MNEQYIIELESKAKTEIEEIKEFLRICEVCRDYYGVDADMFYNGVKIRTRDVVDCRAVAIWFGYQYFISLGKLAWSRMANVLKMDHASMIHNKNKVDSLLRFDKPTKLAVEQLKKMI